MPPQLRTGQVPLVRGRARPDAPVDLSAVPEADKTKENRGAVGIKHDRSGSLTTNSASGTIGGDTPPPIFDRAAIAAGQKGAAVADRIAAGTGRPGGTGQSVTARGTPRLGALGDPLPPRADPPAVVPPPYTPQKLAALADDSAGNPRLAVPVGEFDDSQTQLAQDKLRVAYSHATVKRDTASALLGLAEPVLTAVKPPAVQVVDPAEALRGDVTFNDTSGSSTGRFERGDPTSGDDDEQDATRVALPAPGRASSGTLRSAAALPRTRGIAGDLRYVATVVFGVRDARRELAALEARQTTRQQSRRHHLITLGRAAVTLPEWPERSQPGPGTDLDHPALGPAREQLAGVEDERSQHAGHVIAADAELTRVRRDRDARAKQYVVDLAALDAELVRLGKQLEPLEKEVTGIKKRAADLQEALRRIDGKIAAMEAKLGSGKAGGVDGRSPEMEGGDRAAIQAELASLRADRKAIQADEPTIAGALDAANPRIAAIEAARGEAQRKRAEIEASEHDDQRRAEELLAAIGAKRKVVDRAAADAEVLRDKILFQLGERLYVDRPDSLTAQLAPIDEIDVELGSADRRMMELREILSSIDRLKLARGALLIVAILGALGALAAGAIYLLR